MGGRVESGFELGITCSDTMRKSNRPNLISKDVLRDEGCPWLINCTTQEYLVNVGLNSHFNNFFVDTSYYIQLTYRSVFYLVQLIKLRVIE
jgi:hypothetical protein